MGSFYLIKCFESIDFKTSGKVKDKENVGADLAAN